MAVQVREMKACRGCGGQTVQEVINLGKQAVVDFPEVGQRKELRAPLELVRCKQCSLVQLAHTVDQQRLYARFWYRSGISETMRTALDEVVRRVHSVVKLEPGDRVLDVGMNDGTLLENYPPFITTVGIDPCRELVMEAQREKRVDVALTGFFSEDKLREFGPFKAITAIAMFYDVPDPRQFLQDCRSLLADDGVLIIQMNYLKTMLEDTIVDQISHEHLTYWSLTTLARITEAVGLDIAGAETNDVNGGSIRVYITRKGQGLTGLSLDRQMTLYGKKAALMLEESRMRLDDGAIYKWFRSVVAQKMNALRSYLLSQKQRGAKMYVYGASTRGTALLQVLDLPEGTFLGAAERDERKYGRMMVGSWIPIIPEQQARAEATHLLVLPYSFKEQIVLREAQWLAMGGTMIFPLPVPTILKDGVEKPLNLHKIERTAVPVGGGE